MPFALILIGILMVSSGIKGTEHQLSAQLGDDLTGNDGFIAWIVAFVLIGLVSKIPGFKTPSQWFLALTMIAIILRNSNIFPNAITGITSVEKAGPTQAVALNTGQTNLTGSQAGAGIIGDLTNLAGVA